MANELSTLGVSMKYAAETTAGTKPSSFSTAIPNIKSIPSFDSAPETLDVTDLSDTVQRRGIPGLKGLNDSMEFKVNLTKAFHTAWTALMTAYTTAKSSGKAVWFQINIPNFGTFEFSGEPRALGLSSIEVNSVLECSAYIVPNTIDGFTVSQ